MRELRVISEESTSTSLVLVDESGEQFFLVVDDDVRSALTGSTPASSLPEASTDEENPAPSTPEVSVAAADTPAPEPRRSLPEPDPLYSAPLNMRPREIQTRIRAGATTEELADEMGVAVSRVEAYAHPVLLERQQIAELARASHPIREDGPAKLTLAEVLAAAFGARGHSLSDATWDAFKEPDGQWIVRVSWQAGLSHNEAEWIFRRQAATGGTTEARNAVAADLTDPDFVQPVRTLTSISRGTRHEASLNSPRGAEDTQDIPVVPEDSSDASPRESHTQGEELLQHPDAEQKQPTQRRRKAVTPHWEDVLLGVRANTKRPKK
ncbi:septation protein SepH [Corynebacterium tapiri]|uniref:DUF3071 domain-containing protein n=1 Tax=Corynebacterium tapiri TaxID=1448266 RepID=A0A5C4U668_9CORY|nr:septation protein SepH [Corynebacterium tapiri]TNM00392.1 DUF3071 domain-containing protein [Corynebacterium tapiri]